MSVVARIGAGSHCPPPGISTADAIRGGPAEIGHPVQDLAAQEGFTPLPSCTTGSQTGSVKLPIRTCFLSWRGTPLLAQQAHVTSSQMAKERVLSRR
jgi:hypothetical protein